MHLLSGPVSTLIFCNPPIPENVGNHCNDQTKGHSYESTYLSPIIPRMKDAIKDVNACVKKHIAISCEVLYCAAIVVQYIPSVFPAHSANIAW